MKKVFRISLLIFLLCFNLVSMTFFLKISSYRNVDNDVRFLLSDKAINNITVGENFTSMTDFCSDNISFIIFPTKKVDINSYLLLAKELKENGHDVYIVSYLMNEFYTDETLNEIIKDKEYYVISHGDIDDDALKHIKRFKNIKGVILLDGNIVNYNNVLYLCSDNINHKNCNYIKGGSFDGYANYEDKMLNKLTSSDQQRKTVELILNFVGECNEE